MIIIGCDFHPSWQQICWLNTETGETGERKLMHATGEAERYYSGLTGPVRVGLESTGNSHWFVDMLTEMGHEVWVGDAAKIRAKQIGRHPALPLPGSNLFPGLLGLRYSCHPK